MDTLAKATSKGIFWSLLDNLAKQGIHFIIGIVLARLLMPEDFGLIGMCAILIALGNTFVDSGFGIALIRKSDCTEEDYNTVFYYNLGISLLFYLVLFVTSPLISSFFHQPQLTEIIKVLGLGIVIGSLNIIQRTILTKEINFKLQTKITIISMILSGTIGITMAILGFGVWSLVFQSLAGSFMGVILMWIFNGWRPKLVFSKKSFKELFAFGSNLLITDIIETIYRNVYYIVIGRYFSPTILGYFSRAENTVSLMTNNVTNTVKRVSYPVLAKLQNDDDELKKMYKKLVKNTMLISFSLLFGLAASAESLIVVLIGEKWLPSVPLIQLLCFSGVFMPLTIFNLNGINVKGESKLYLKLQLTNKLMAIPVVIVGVIFGIKSMLLGFVGVSFIYYLINVHFSARLINYSFIEQIKDLMPTFLVSGCISLLIYGITFIGLNSLLTFVIQFSLGLTLTILIYNIIKLPEYLILQQKLITFLKIRESYNGKGKIKGKSADL